MRPVAHFSPGIFFDAVDYLRVSSFWHFLRRAFFFEGHYLRRAFFFEFPAFSWTFAKLLPMASILAGDFSPDVGEHGKS